ncbi:MAG: aspartate 1-decarboxylase [Sedimentisphaerales bacterium]|nr:aspartate 1-decarboxylase [Sedimentisphaerales bacterium]
MFYKVLKSKIHRAAVTEARVDYPGSIEIDAELMQACGLEPYESVIVADLDNGKRLETYVVSAEAGSKKVVILGAAARLINPKDRVIVLNFGFYSQDELKDHNPKVIVLDEKNNIIG